ncbi:PAS domain-containing protein [Aliifodinibius salicampi]|uniref:histidine kinase n=1 Tax=Fodinibius salicampi TaxID=1920655 RepID=A0ABT3Q235_9BACT|nr:histidine kinase dimerization/phosphoacceptor domain -containing protein [Fodinibius salicampi]MCW9714158.1 PAS domain-containing protein [Fodinibius salicampi]
MEEINMLSSEVAPYLFDKNPSPMVIFDRDSLQIVKVNEAACERYGYSREEFRNLDLTQIRPKEDIPILMESLNQVDGQNERSVFRHLTKDGETFYAKIKPQKIDIEGRSLQLAVIDDITSEIEAKIQAQQAGQLARLGWWRYEVAENRFIWSDKLYDIMDVDKETFEANFETFYELIYPEDRPKMVKIIKQIRETNEARDFVIRGVMQNEEISYLKCRAQGEFNSEGKLVRLNGVTLDITQLKQQEQKIQQSLKEKEVLLEEIHHRVKNNLTVISGLLELQRYEPVESLDALIDETQSRIKSIAKIHEKLYQSATLSDVNIKEYIEDFSNIISDTFNSEQRAIVITKDLQPLTVDITNAVPLGLVINELLTNAFKHGFSDIHEGEIRITMEKANEEAMLSVADNGHPLPDDFSLESSSSLGMTLIKTLISQLEGDITISQGEWTTFEVTFPYST